MRRPEQSALPLFLGNPSAVAEWVGDSIQACELVLKNSGCFMDLQMLFSLVSVNLISWFLQVKNELGKPLCCQTHMSLSTFPTVPDHHSTHTRKASCHVPNYHHVLIRLLFLVFSCFSPAIAGRIPTIVKSWWLLTKCGLLNTIKSHSQPTVSWFNTLPHFDLWGSTEWPLCHPSILTTVEPFSLSVTLYSCCVAPQPFHSVWMPDLPAAWTPDSSPWQHLGKSVRSSLRSAPEGATSGILMEAAQTKMWIYNQSGRFCGDCVYLDTVNRVNA